MTKDRHEPRIHDVAALAGVSVATVSRVMSNPAIVSKAAREAVERAIVETGYRLNVTARNLRQRQVGAVLALVPRLANPFFSQILSGIAEVLSERKLNLLVLDTDGPVLTGRPEALGAWLTRSHADGVIVLDGRLGPELFASVHCPPVVQACEWIAGLDAPRILADNVEGGRLAVRHLAELGHRYIAHLAGPAGNSLSISRRKGVERGFEETGIASEAAELRLSGEFSLRSGNAAAADLLSNHRQATAVFCDSDEMAIGLVHGLAGAGIRVPHDISVVGFDNIEMSAYALPPLTTIRQHRHRIGRKAAETLIALVRQEPCAPETILPVELLVRDSTRAPR
ncbi:LacI family transcriptional regulator [Fulvimarina endophytica]|uniref:LacI family transcriptional regulator n=1 Tax=Fulvimarina endophytica TaxID=2293836 RepID=A0A371X5K4_9HYPH|nr:LacI family transcriptional regulator [Fulvimarina endophytica]